MRTLLLIAIALTLASADYVEYSQCTDKNFCQKSTCQTVTLPCYSCIANDNTSTSMQRLICDPMIRSCGILVRYFDKECTMMDGTQALECNQCQRYKKQFVECASEDGNQTVILYKCGSEECKNCTKEYVISTKLCFPLKDDSGKIISYAKYAGATLCTMVDHLVWHKSRECSGSPDFAQRIPTDRCMNGGEASCHYTQR